MCLACIVVDVNGTESDCGKPINAPDPIQGVMIRGRKEGKGKGKGRGTDHYTLDGIGGIPRETG